MENKEEINLQNMEINTNKDASYLDKYFMENDINVEERIPDLVDDDDDDDIQENLMENFTKKLIKMKKNIWIV